MNAVASSDWDQLAALARKAGVPEERVAAARKRIEGPDESAIRPVTLIIGRPNAGIEMLLARWLCPEAAEQLIAGTNRPLVLGRNPSLQPRLGTWPCFRTPSVMQGHVIAIRTAGKPSAELLAQLASVGTLDRVVIVVSLNQPMHMQEREIAAACATLAASARVVAVGVPGQEPAKDELVELAANLRLHLKNAGFGSARCQAAGSWFTAGEHREGAIPDIGAFLLGGDPPTESAKNELKSQNLAALFADIERRAGSQAATEARAIPEVEQDRLARELAACLSDLGRELDRRVSDDRRNHDVKDLRKQALNFLKGWGSHLGVEGHWMKYVDKLRPSAHAALLSESEAAMADLDFSSEITGLPSPRIESPRDRWTLLAQQSALGLFVGVGGYLATSALLSNLSAVPMPALLNQAISLGGFLVAGLFGFRACSRFMSQPAIRPACETPRPPAIHGWNCVQQRIVAWFRSFLATPPRSLADECKALSKRLGLMELKS